MTAFRQSLHEQGDCHGVVWVEEMWTGKKLQYKNLLTSLTSAGMTGRRFNTHDTK